MLSLTFPVKAYQLTAGIPDLEAVSRVAYEALVVEIVIQIAKLMAQEEKRINKEQHKKIIDISAKITEPSAISQQINNLKLPKRSWKP